MKDSELIVKYLENSVESIKHCGNRINELIDISNVIVKTLQNGGKILFCGNGGSAAQSQHLAAEFSGRFLLDRPGLSAISLTTDTSAITAIANDYGYKNVFKRQVLALGSSEDILIGLSTSGKSNNIIEAFNAAKEKKLITIAIIGSNKTEMSHLADYVIHCKGTSTNFIQEEQFVLGHIICYLVEKNLDYSKLN